MDPFDSEPPGGDARRLDRLAVWASTAGAIVCSVLVFLATNVSEPEPVAEPVPTTTTTTSPTTPTTTTTTTTASPTTTTPAATVTTPRTTTRKLTHSSTTARTTTTTTTPPRTTTTRTTTTRRCAVATWQRDTAYNGGSFVSWDGALWIAKWWNYNAVPGANAEGVWVRTRWSC